MNIPDLIPFFPPNYQYAPPHAKNWLTGKDPDAGKDWRWEKGTTEDEMVGWHHRLDAANSGSWWWTGRPGVLQSMGSQRARQDWATKLNWTTMSNKHLSIIILIMFFFLWTETFSKNSEDAGFTWMWVSPKYRVSHWGCLWMRMRFLPVPLITCAALGWVWEPVFSIHVQTFHGTVKDDCLAALSAPPQDTQLRPITNSLQPLCRVPQEGQDHFFFFQHNNVWKNSVNSYLLH